MIPSLEGWPTRAKEATSPHEVRMSPLDTNPIFQSLRGALSFCDKLLEDSCCISQILSIYFRFYSNSCIVNVCCHVYTT